MTPKHQRKINEVYPSTAGIEGAVKSKLSALHYYLNERPSKFSKAIEYLERKTNTDLQKGRIGYNKVALDILVCIFENCSQHYELFSISSLRIIHTLLPIAELTAKATSTV